jgi:hypothetical protein
MIVCRRIVALVLLTWVAGISAQETETSAIASAPAYVILMQDFSTDDALDCYVPICQGLGQSVIEGVLALENSARRKSLRQQLEVLRTRLPDLDLYERTRAEFCRELMLENPDCAEVTVLGPGSATRVAEVTKNSSIDRAANTIVVRLSIEYTRLMRFNELRVIAALSEVGADKGKPMAYVWYVTPGGDTTQSSPLEPPAAKPTARQLATDAYWFGKPSRMEAELRQAIPEVARMIRALSPYLPRFGTTQKRWDTLPVMADLQAVGKLTCRGVSCKFTVLGATDRRVWFTQQADAPVVMSVPLDTWK